MKNIVSHIRYLLTQYDCVVVPGWGALVVQHNAATFDLENNVVAPPSRWLSFNPLLAHNDGILAHSLMRSYGCTYEQAVMNIEEQVAQWRDEMMCNDVVVWEKIGTFSKQDNTTMLFTEVADAEISASLSLLQPLSLPTLSQVLIPVEEEKNEAEEDLLPTPQIRIGRARRIWQAVASIAVIVMVMLSISTPVDDFQSNQDYASLVAVEMLGCTPVQDVEAEAQEPVVEQEILDVVADCEEPDIVAQDNVVTENSEVEIEPVEVEVADVETADAHPRYILVIGSLPSLSQAQKQIANFRAAGVTQDIKIYEAAGKYRLYIEGYASMSQAQERLDTLVAQQDTSFAGVWICSTRK